MSEYDVLLGDDAREFLANKSLVNPIVVDACKEGFGLVDDHYYRQAWDFGELRQRVSMEIVAAALLDCIHHTG